MPATEETKPRRNALTQRLDCPKKTALATGAMYLLLAILRLASHDFDPSVFVQAGTWNSHPGEVPSQLTVMHDGPGYDGQYFYRLALNPFNQAVNAYGIRLDAPAYRSQRIGYPFLAWALALGQPGAVIWTLILVNFLAVVATGYFAGWLARFLGAHAGIGLIISLYPGLIMAFSRDMAECTAVAFLLAGLVASLSRRHVLSMLALSLGVLTRETTLLLSVALAADALLAFLRREPNGDIRALVLRCVPGGVWVVWTVINRLKWGHLPAGDNRQALGIPFMGLRDFLVETWPLDTVHKIIWVLEILSILALAVAAARCAWNRSAPRPILFAWCLYATLASALYFEIWREDWGFMRILTEFFAMSVLVILTGPNRWRWVFAPWFAWIAFHWLLRTDVLQSLGFGGTQP
jgi:hypothetical protein